MSPQHLKSFDENYTIREPRFSFFLFDTHGTRIITPFHIKYCYRTTGGEPGERDTHGTKTTTPFHIKINIVIQQQGVRGA